MSAVSTSSMPQDRFKLHISLNCFVIQESAVSEEFLLLLKVLK